MQTIIDVRGQVMDEERKKRIGNDFADFIIVAEKPNIVEFLIKFPVDDDFLAACMALFYERAHHYIGKASDRRLFMLEFALSRPELRSELISELRQGAGFMTAPWLREFKRRVKNYNKRR